MKENYDLLMQNEIAGFGSRRPRLLLHVCCAPCTSSVIERIAPHFETTLFYYNPNIQPEAEFARRGETLKKLLRENGMEKDVPLLIPDYDGEAFLTAAEGLEKEPEGGRRCPRCFTLRLRKTAEAAREGGFEYFCTTLTVSPHKNAELINAIGAELAAEAGVSWLPADFKKRDGYLRSIELSRLYGLYRQDYCGCLFAKTTDQKV